MELADYAATFNDSVCRDQRITHCTSICTAPSIFDAFTIFLEIQMDHNGARGYTHQQKVTQGGAVPWIYGSLSHLDLEQVKHLGLPGNVRARPDNVQHSPTKSGKACECQALPDILKERLHFDDLSRTKNGLRPHLERKASLGPT